MDETLDACRAFAMMNREISDEDLRHALNAVSMAESAGPVFLPTEYILAQNDGRLVRQRELLNAVVEFRSALERLFPDTRLVWS